MAAKGVDDTGAPAPTAGDGSHRSQPRGSPALSSRNTAPITLAPRPRPAAAGRLNLGPAAADSALMARPTHPLADPAPQAFGRCVVLAAALSLAGALLALPAGAAVVEIRATGSDGKALPETVIFLESPAAKAAARPLPGVEVEQAARRFTHRLTVVTTGTEVRFPNRDTVRHHVYSFSPTKAFEIKLYAGTPANPVLFDKPGVAVLGCNIHDNMVAWVVVVDTPYHAVAGPQGVVRLDNVPPGSYRLRSWHPGLPPGSAAAEQALVVAADGGAAAVQLALVASKL